MNAKLLAYTIFGWFFGFLFSAIAAINIFWGNDQEFGVFLLLLSLLFFPPFSNQLAKAVRFSLPPVVKILLGALILWASLGVGELLDKIEMMNDYFSH